MTTRTHVEFQKMWIDLAGSPLEQLKNGEILHAQAETAAFVLALDTSKDPDRLFDRIVTSVDAFGALEVPIFCVLFTPDQLESIEDRAPQYVWVPAVDHAGLKAGEMRFALADDHPLKTELGVHDIEPTVLNELRRGDVFAIVERDGWQRWRLSRALDEDEPSIGLPAEYLRPRQGEEGERRISLSGNHMVFRLKDPTDVLGQIGMHDIRQPA